jgi:hypothetical protein
MYGEGRGVCRILVGRPEGRKPLGRPRHRWEDYIKMDLQEVGWGVWTGLSWLRIGTGWFVVWFGLVKYSTFILKSVYWHLMEYKVVHVCFHVWWNSSCKMWHIRYPKHFTGHISCTTSWGGGKCNLKMHSRWTTEVGTSVVVI